MAAPALRPSRRYTSPARKAQADLTRRKIADAARAVLLDRGYEATTIGAIAERAGVAVQTVYAGFGSKRGIVAALLDQVRFGPAYAELVRQVSQTQDPAARLRIAARIANQIHDAERGEMELLRGTVAVSPDLAQIEADNECRRRDAQASLVAALQASGQLRPELSVDDARDILWGLTGRDLYRAFVVIRTWPSSRFEQWLADTLVRSLLRDQR
jgi:AcrR family transcriptional regulator